MFFLQCKHNIHHVHSGAVREHAIFVWKFCMRRIVIHFNSFAHSKEEKGCHSTDPSPGTRRRERCCWPAAACSPSPKECGPASAPPSPRSSSS